MSTYLWPYSACWIIVNVCGYENENPLQELRSVPLLILGVGVDVALAQFTGKI